MIWVAVAWAATAVVEARDAGGRVVHRVESVEEQVVREVWASWTPDGRPLSRREQTTSVSEERWEYDRFGRETLHELTRDGVVARRELSAWAHGRLVQRSFLDGSSTVYDWAVDGAPLGSRTVNASGEVIEATRVTPTGDTPWVTTFDLGVSGDTDVESLGGSVTAGLERRPTPSRYAVDPVEFRVQASWVFSRIAGETANDQQSLRVSADWNEVWGRWTPFAYVDASRNPAANLNWDVVVSPLGVKLDLVRTPNFALDVSGALPYELRDVDGECAFEAQDGRCLPGAWRGSLRARAVAWGRLRETVELQPSLLPKSGNFLVGLGEEGLVRSTTTLELPINRVVTWKQSLIVVRDPRLVAQADCASKPNRPLCRGLSVETNASISLRWSHGSR
jgi:hypothetical protein